MPRPLILFIAFSLFSAHLYSAEFDPKSSPSVEKALDKATEAVAQNRKAYDDANQKVIEEASEALSKEVERLTKAGKLEEAIAVKKFAESMGKEVLRKADSSERARKPPIPKGAVAWNGHKYMYFDDRLSWHDAQRRCEGMGGYLVIIDDQAEQDFVARSVARINGGKVAAWLGITCDGTPGRWRTVKGQPLAFAKWHRGEPSNSNDRESCGVLDTVRMGGHWNDVSRDTLTSFVCEWDD